MHVLLGELHPQQLDQLVANIKAGNTVTASVDKWEFSTGPMERKGVGFTEATRGALRHWVKIKDDVSLEILRTIHSFDPCLACSTHVMSPDGQELTAVKVLLAHPAESRMRAALASTLNVRGEPS